MQVVLTTMALDLIVQCNSDLPIVACIRDRLGVYLMFLAESPMDQYFQFFNNACL